MFTVRYQSATRNSNGERPGARLLQNDLLARIGAYPKVRTIDSGIYNYRPIRGSRTRLSIHSEGRAGDTGLRHPDGRWPTTEIPEPGIWDTVNQMVDQHQRIGLQSVIYARRRWSVDDGWLPYRGTSPHYDHIHWELTREAGELLTPAHIALAFHDQSSTKEHDTMLEFIELSYEAVGRDSAALAERKGIAYWYFTAHDEDGLEATATIAECRASPVLTYMAAVLTGQL